jgi:hypothetical protein
MSETTLGKFNNITEFIRHVLTLYNQTPQEINNGNCEDFSKDIWAHWPGVTLHGVEDFQLNGLFDWDLLSNSYWKITVPAGRTIQSLNDANLGGHLWIACQSKHYDAECPEGVDSFFDLPFFKRQLELYDNK